MSDTIQVGEQLQSDGRIPPEAVERALSIFRDSGYVVLEGLLPQGIVDELCQAYTQALDQKIARIGVAQSLVADANERHEHVSIRFEPKGGNHDVNRWNMHLPSRAPFLDVRVIANPVVLQLMCKLLDDPVLFLIASDTPLPGSTYQNIHQDYPRFGITVNVPLVDFTDDNAPLELWPRSHLPTSHLPNPTADGAAFTKTSHWHSPDALRELVARMPCRRMLLRRGSVLLRDHRLVHRGTHNASEGARPALSLWYKEAMTAPHPAVAHLCRRLSLAAREHARRGGVIRNHHLLNKGNMAGRVIDERTNTDRDYRRQLPAGVWDALPAEAQRTLRFAEVEGRPSGRGDVVADLALLGSLARVFLGPDYVG